MRATAADCAPPRKAVLSTMQLESTRARTAVPGTILLVAAQQLIMHLRHTNDNHCKVS